MKFVLTLCKRWDFVLLGGDDATEPKKDGKRKFITREQEPEQ